MLLLLAVGQVCLNHTSIKNDEEDIQVVSILNSDTKVCPLLYYEENWTNEEYKTHTYLLGENQFTEIGTHYRSYSKTYPSEIWERFGGYEKMQSQNGQVMFYLKNEKHEIIIFDQQLSEQPKKEFLIISGERIIHVPYNSGDSFINFCFFQGSYYLLVFSQCDDLQSDYDTIRIQKISENMKLVDTSEMNIAKIGLAPYNFVNHSATIIRDTLVFPIHNNNEYSILAYDIVNDEASFWSIDYGILATISSENDLFAVGYNDTEIVIEKYSASGASLERQTVPYPVAIQMSNESISIDDEIFLVNNHFYFSFRFGDRYCLCSYDYLSNKWDNTWVVETNNPDILLMDIKYVEITDGNIYDLLSNCVNKLSK